MINPSITIRITPKTTLLLDYERHQNDHSNTRDVWITDNGRAPNGDFYGIFYEGRNTGTNRVLATPDQRLFSFQGPDIYRKQRAHATVVRLDHAFTDDLQAWIGYSSQDYHVSERTWNIALRNWNANEIPLKVRTDPRFQALMRPAFAGQTPQVMDIRPNNETPDSVGRFPNIKSEIYYSFSTGPVKHTVIGGIEYGDLKILNTSTRYFYYGNSSQPTNPATIAWENLPVDVILSRFRSPLDFTTVQRWNESVISQYPQGYTNGIGLPSAVSTSYFYDRNIYANLQSQYFNGKLQTIIGGTWQRSDRQTRVFDAEGRFLWASPAPAGAPAGVLTGIMRPEPVRALAPSVTAIWLPNSSIRFYGNAMSSTNPGNAYSSYDGAGKPMDAPIITNGELGFRAEFWKDRILFNFAYFRATREGLPRNIPIAFQNAVINPTSGAEYTSGFGANVATDDEAKGYEVKVDFVVNPSLRFNLSMTENKLQITKIDPFLAPAHPNPSFLAAQLAFLATGRDANSYIGTNPDDRSIHTATGFVRYEVKTGRLRGLWGFFGAKYLGHRESETVTLNTANDTISVSPNYVPSHYLFDFNAGYRHRVGRYGLEYQLNIANLLDDHKYYGGGWQSPRTIRVSAAINF